MSENVIQINGKDYDTNSLSREQNYLVAQIKSLQAKSNSHKFELDQAQAALNHFTNALISSIEKKESNDAVKTAITNQRCVIDPLTVSAAISTATAAFNGIKKAFQAGRDLEAMAGDLSRWMGAVSDVDHIHKSSKSPSMLKKMFAAQSVEQEAIEAFAAKKKLEQQRDDLKTYIMFTQGTKAWDELVETEVNIRKQRKKMVYEAQQRREKILNIVFICLALAALTALGSGLLYVIVLNI